VGSVAWDLHRVSGLRLVPTRAVPHAARGWSEKRPGDSQASGALFLGNPGCVGSKLKMAGTHR